MCFKALRNPENTISCSCLVVGNVRTVTIMLKFQQVIWQLISSTDNSSIHPLHHVIVKEEGYVVIVSLKLHSVKFKTFRKTLIGFLMLLPKAKSMLQCRPKHRYLYPQRLRDSRLFPIVSGTRRTHL